MVACWLTTGLFWMFFVLTAKLSGLMRQQACDENSERRDYLLQRVEGILSELRPWGKVTNEKTDGAASEGILKDSCQFGVAVRDATLMKQGFVNEGRAKIKTTNTHSALIESMHDLPQDAERLVDCGRLGHASRVVPGKLRIYEHSYLDKAEKMKPCCSQSRQDRQG